MAAQNAAKANADNEANVAAEKEALNAQAAQAAQTARQAAAEAADAVNAEAEKSGQKAAEQAEQAETERENKNGERTNREFAGDIERDATKGNGTNENGEYPSSIIKIQPWHAEKQKQIIREYLNSVNPEMRQKADMYERDKSAQGRAVVLQRFTTQ